jgi:hypothetical protein
LRAARIEDARWRATIAARAGELGGLVRRLGRDADDALAEATTSGPERFRETASGRAFGGDVQRAMASLRRRLDAYAAEVDAGVDALSGRGFTDASQALARFDAMMAARLGGSGAPVAVRRVARVAAPRPRRKQARVPKFLIAKFYKEGNLRQRGDRVEVTFTNPLAFCIVQGGDAVLVDGQPFPKERTVLDSGDKRVTGTALSEKDYLKFPKGAAIVVSLEGLSLSPGRHHIACALELRKMGWVELDVRDAVA